MSNRVAQPPAGNDAPPGPSIGRRPRSGTKSSRHIAALIAGASILLLAALAAFANIAVLQGLVTEGDAAKTAKDILASDGTFRVGITSLYAVVALDVLVAWALMGVFRPVHAGLSRLAAWFRLAYAAVFLVAIAQLAGIPDLLSTRDSAVFTPGQVDATALAKVGTFTDIWMAGLLLFGVHLTLLGFLVFRSGQMPRLLGILLVVAGVGYAFDTMAAVLSTGSVFAVSTVTFLGESLLALWLLIRGHRLTPDHAPFDTASTTVVTA
jgi:Domain of unknown function (DUF4386)